MPSATPPRRPGRLWLRLILLAALLGGSLPGVVVDWPPPPARSRIARPVLGAQVHGTWTTWSDRDVGHVLDLLAAAGIGLVRVDLGWESLEPFAPRALDARAVERFDRVVRGARSRGMEVLGTLWATPEWANGGRPPGVAPDDPAEYGRIAGWVARRWRGQVRAWEVWNEPNHPSFLEGTDPAAYVALLAAAAPAIRDGDPDALVVFGGPAYNDVSWIRRAYDAGAGGLFDVLALHPYTQPSDAPPTLTEIAPGAAPSSGFHGLPAVQALQAERGDSGMPIWLTEFGWSAHPNEPDTPGWARGVSPRTQADYLVQTIDLLRETQPGVEVAVWYAARDTDEGDLQFDSYGLLTYDLRPKPAWYALRRALTGAAGSIGVESP